MRVLIVEDHPVTAEGLRSAISGSHEVVGILHDGAAVAPWFRTKWADLVLLDLSLPGKLGSAVLLELLDLPLPPKVLIVSMHDEPAFRSELKARGASGFLSKESPASLLLGTITAIEAGEVWFPGSGENDQRASHLQRGLVLAPRQLEVLRCIAHGLTRDEIAGSLGMALATVDEHKARLKEIFGVANSLELPAAAIAHGFASPLKLFRDVPPGPATTGNGIAGELVRVAPNPSLPSRWLSLPSLPDSPAPGSK